jgi:glycerol-3-phosphate cytidylyltransferase
MILGYTTGVFDLFHIGHLNLLRNARALCDRLIVGVSTDALVSYKHKAAVIPFHERVEIVRACRYVDAVIAQDDLDKYKAWERIRFNVLFVGDDWYETPSWRDLEARFSAEHVRVVYFPYTQGTSSTLINDVLKRLRDGASA